MRPTSVTHVMGPSGPVSSGIEAKGLRSSRSYGLATLRATFPTATPGPNTFSVNAVDNVGNSASSSVTYTVE